MYAAAGEQGAERMEQEKAELLLLSQWLPALADEATTRQWIADAILANGDAPLIAGKIMGAVMKLHRADVDSKLAQTLAAEMCA